MQATDAEMAGQARVWSNGAGAFPEWWPSVPGQSVERLSVGMRGVFGSSWLVSPLYSRQRTGRRPPRTAPDPSSCMVGHGLGAAGVEAASRPASSARSGWTAGDPRRAGPSGRTPRGRRRAGPGCRGAAGRRRAARGARARPPVPAYITARRSEKWLTRDMSWVTKMMAKPSSSLELLDLDHQRALGHDVECRGGLVHDDQVRREQQGHGDHGPLAHPPRELVGVARQVYGVDADQAGPRRNGPGSRPSGLFRRAPSWRRELWRDRYDRVEGVHGDCITTERPRQRTARSCLSVKATMFCPLKTTVPPVTSAGGFKGAQRQTEGWTCRSRTHPRQPGTRLRTAGS